MAVGFLVGEHFPCVIIKILILSPEERWQVPLLLWVLLSLGRWFCLGCIRKLAKSKLVSETANSLPSQLLFGLNSVTDCDLEV